MSVEMFTTAEKLEFVESLIEISRSACRAAGKDSDAFRRFRILKSIAADLRARQDGNPSAALTQIESRIGAAIRSKTGLGYSQVRIENVGYEVMARWPVIKQALELFGATAEEQHALGDEATGVDGG